MSDFDVLLNWYRQNVNPDVEEEILRKLYDTHYSCDCQSCQTRKERGFLPIHQGKDCKLPIGSFAA